LRILVTGLASYVGNSFVRWCALHAQQFTIHSISMRSEQWKTHDLRNYDAILHVAGIAHVPSHKQSQDKYEQVNHHLTVELAQQAKAQGVKQFIFMSSILVYGDGSPIGQKKVIDLTTIPEPTNSYGQSKLHAERALFSMQDEQFKIAAIRSPFVYGKDCKGNYSKLAKIARISPVFPDVVNERSMIHIDHLCELLRLLIVNQDKGIFYPQNQEYVKSTELVQFIAQAHRHRMWITRIFNPFLRLFSGKVGVINKLFGNLVYDQSISHYREPYAVHDLRKTIALTEK
jgi:nucleoside-diphosphate-sugar epimerase